MYILKLEYIYIYILYCFPDAPHELTPKLAGQRLTQKPIEN